jgi:hypothetical protein
MAKEHGMGSVFLTAATSVEADKHSIIPFGPASRARSKAICLLQVAHD